MPLPDRIKLPFTFDRDRLRADLQRVDASTWIDHFVKQNYDGQWSVVPLRGPAGASHPVMMAYSDPASSEFADTPFLNGCNYFRNVLGIFRCPVQSVRLMRLAPGSVIKEHSDHDLAAEAGFARIHIPIRTNPDVEFRLNGSRIDLREGECWYLRLRDPHSVENRGKEDRVHLVIDAVVNEWLENLLGAAC